MESTFDKLDAIKSRYEEINNLMAQEEVVSDYEYLQKLAQEQALIRDTALQYQKYRKVVEKIDETRAMQLDDIDECL